MRVGLSFTNQQIFTIDCLLLCPDCMADFKANGEQLYDAALAIGAEKHIPAGDLLARAIQKFHNDGHVVRT